MRGAPIRAAIVVAAIVVGAVVLAKGFSAGGQLITAPSKPPSPSSSPSPTPSASRSTTGGNPTPSGKTKGVIVAIFNTTNVVGLAACAAVDLSKLGYVVPASSVLQAPPGSTAPETEILYRGAQGKADAELLAKGYFKDQRTRVGPLQSTADVPKHAELAIFLGTQYASSHQGGC